VLAADRYRWRPKRNSRQRRGRERKWSLSRRSVPEKVRRSADNAQNRAAHHLFFQLCLLHAAYFTRFGGSRSRSALALASACCFRPAVSLAGTSGATGSARPRAARWFWIAAIMRLEHREHHLVHHGDAPPASLRLVSLVVAGVIVRCGASGSKSCFPICDVVNRLLPHASPSHACAGGPPSRRQGIAPRHDLPP